jgi:hypothetical protein
MKKARLLDTGLVEHPMALVYKIYTDWKHIDAKQLTNTFDNFRYDNDWKRISSDTYIGPYGFSYPAMYPPEVRRKTP